LVYKLWTQSVYNQFVVGGELEIGGPRGRPAARADTPTTTSVRRRVKPGHEGAYEEILKGIIAAARRSPGFLGVEVFRPDSPGGEYQIVYRFDAAENLQRWLASEERDEWLMRASPHVAGPTRTQFLTGLESWFTLPSGPQAAPPPPHKMALLTWLTIFPLITGVIVALNPLLHDVALVPRLAITTAVTVSLMSWVVMPRVTRALRPWLYPSTGRRP
jgi:uncharacterized protein